MNVQYSVADCVWSQPILLLDPPTPRRRVEERRIRILNCHQALGTEKA